MTKRPLSHLLSLLVLVMIPAGCKGDEPSVPVAPDAATATIPAPKQAAKAGSSKAAASGADKVVAAMTAPASKPGPELPIAPLTLGAFPDNVMAVAGAPGLEQLLARYAVTARRTGADTVDKADLERALARLKTRLALTDLDWLATDKPLRVAIPDRKRYEDGFAVLLPHRGDEAAVKLAIPMTPAEGHAGSLDVEGRKVFFDFVPGHLVVTSHPTVHGELKGFITEQLVTWTPSASVNFELSVDNLKRLFKAELQAAQGVATALGSRLSKSAAVPVQGETLKEMIGAGFDFIANAGHIGLAIDPHQNALRVSWGLRASDGSSLAGTIDQLAGRTPGLVGLAAPSTWFGLALNIDPALTPVDGQLLVRQFTAPAPRGPGLDKETAERLAKLLEAAVKLHTGDMLLTLSTEGRFPVAIDSVGGVVDKELAKSTYNDILGLIFAQMVAQARAQMPDGGAGIDRVDVRSFADAVKLAGVGLAPLGVTLAIVDEARGNTWVQGLAIDVDWSKTGLELTQPAFYSLAREVLGTHLEVAIAFDANVAVSVGPNGIERAMARARGQRAGGEPSLTKTAAGHFAALSVRVGQALKAFSFLPQLERVRAAIDSLPGDEAFTLGGASDATSLTVDGRLSMPLIEGLLKLD